jgi:hypothetical protein
MAYISNEEVKTIRENIKNAFPKSFKFSIVRQHYSVVRVHLMESPLKFPDRLDINDMYLDEHKTPHKTILRLMKDIVNVGNFDHSNSHEDYTHVGFYTHIEIGKWDKPYKQTA